MVIQPGSSLKNCSQPEHGNLLYAVTTYTVLGRTVKAFFEVRYPFAEAIPCRTQA